MELLGAAAGPWKEKLWGWLEQAGCPSCHPTNRVKHWRHCQVTSQTSSFIDTTMDSWGRAQTPFT